MKNLGIVGVIDIAINRPILTKIDIIVSFSGLFL